MEALILSFKTEFLLWASSFKTAYLFWVAFKTYEWIFEAAKKAINGETTSFNATPKLPHIPESPRTNKNNTPMTPQPPDPPADPKPYATTVISTKTERKENKKRMFKLEYNPTAPGLAFICAPFSGDVEGNKKKAGELARLLTFSEYVPFVPHFNFAYLNENNPEEDRWAIEFCKMAIPHCKILYLDDRRGITKNMAGEIDIAEQYGIRIVRFYPKADETEKEEGVGV